MFWTQNLKPLAIGFALRVVHVTEKSGCSVGKTIVEVDSDELLFRTFVNQSSSSHPSILVGYMEPKEVWLSYCRDTLKDVTKNSASSCRCWSVWSSPHLLHLCITSLHVPQCHFWIDRMTTRHAEDLQVCVITVAFIHLQRKKRDVNQRSASLPVFLTSKSPAEKQRERVRKLWARVHLLVLLNGLLLGLGDDAFQFMEASLHLSEAQPGVLLLPPDAL